MAERRQRQASADRRLISDRTAKGLRILAAPQRVYRDHGVRGLTTRRSLNLTDYLAVPPEEMELDDDNDSLESMVDPSGTLEGTRMNSDLYDAYAGSGLCAFLPLLPILFTKLMPSPTSASPYRTSYLPRSASPPSCPALRHTSRGLGSLARYLPRWMGPSISRCDAVLPSAHPSAVHSAPPGPLPDRRLY
jgi:hypothetical protein